MTRHSKNSTANAVYTYHEKHKDCSMGGYGTTHTRMTKDAIKEFDCCNLTLQPCRDPVITKDGYLFDKQAALGTAHLDLTSSPSCLCFRVHHPSEEVECSQDARVSEATRS